jgi:quercetin dioxygenase-like cupin family protein
MEEGLNLTKKTNRRGFITKGAAAGAVAVAAAASAQAQGKTLPSKVYKYSDLEVSTNPNNQNRQRSVLNGATHTGFMVEMHETELMPGLRPHPPHHHVHEEMFVLRTGTIEITIDGTTTQLEPGSVAFVASNEEHGVMNVGKTPAVYFVLAFGRA